MPRPKAIYFLDQATAHPVVAEEQGSLNTPKQSSIKDQDRYRTLLHHPVTIPKLVKSTQRLNIYIYAYINLCLSLRCPAKQIAKALRNSAASSSLKQAGQVCAEAAPESG